MLQGDQGGTLSPASRRAMTDGLVPVPSARAANLRSSLSGYAIGPLITASIGTLFGPAAGVWNVKRVAHHGQPIERLTPYLGTGSRLAVMRSSQVAAQAGVNVRTLRYYEHRGLLPEPGRLRSGYRAHRPDAARRVRFVKRAQHLGFSLEKIDGLPELATGGPQSCDAARAIAGERAAQLDAKTSTLTPMRASLLQLVSTCDRPLNLRECRLLETLGSPSETGNGAAS